MAEPDSPDSLPTQPWSGPASSPPGVSANPAPAHPTPRRSGWQPPEPEQLQPSFPQYEIRGILGRGGMGAVYQGWQKSLRRLVAIKILPPGLEDDGANFAERFQREAQAMARFSHPGIVAVFDAGETADGLFYFVMEYIEGTDVQKMIRQNGPLPPEHALSITAHVCDALAYAHKRGVIHRDIKPANIMVDAEGQVKVADFGLAKVASDDSAAMVTGSHVSMGTMDFMAPEALYGGMRVVDHRADLYAVGVMLYQMLTGEVPRGRFELPSAHRPGLDVRFDAIVDKAMQKDPEKRYASATEIRTDLDQILTQPVPHRSAVQEAPPPSPAPQAEIRAESPAPAARKTATSPGSSAPQSKPRVWLSTGVVSALALVAGGVIFFHDKPKLQVENAAAPPPASVNTSPAEIWTDAFAAWRNSTARPKWVSREADFYRATGAGFANFWTTPPLKDQAIRASIRPFGSDVSIHVRRSEYENGGTSSYYSATLESSKKRVTLTVADRTPPRTLQTWTLPKTVVSSATYVLELRAVGDQLAVLVNGEMLGQERDSTLAHGSPALYVKSAGVLIEKLEFTSLDPSRVNAGISRSLEPRAIKLWDAPEKLAGSTVARWEENSMRLENGGTPTVPVQGTDGILRARIRRNTTAGETQLNLRASGGSYYRLTFHFTNLEIFRVLKGSGTQIAEWTLPHPRRQGPDEWPLVEFEAVGNTLTATVDGQHVGAIQDDSIPGPGSVAIYANGIGYFRDVVYLPLDQPVGTPATAPPTANGDWQPLFPKSEWEQSGTKHEYKEGLQHITDYWQITRKAPSPDGAIRTRIVLREGSTSPSLTARQSKADGSYKLMVIGRQSILLRYNAPGEAKVGDDIATYRLPVPLKVDETFTLELHLQGDQLTAFYNGTRVIGARDTRINSAGEWGVYAKEGWFESVEVRPLTTSSAFSPASHVEIPPLDMAPPINLPAAGWKPVVPDLNQLAVRQGVTLLPGGWVRLNAAYLQVPPSQHLILRARLRFNGVESWVLKVRESGPNATEAYTVAVAANGSTLILAMRDAANPNPKILTTAQLPRTLSLGNEYDLALAAQGRQLAVFFDRQPLIRWQDAALTGTEATVGSSKSVEFKDAEWVALPTPTP